MKKRIRRTASVMAAALLLTGVPVQAAGGNILYAPGVTAGMNDAEYWLEQCREPDKILASGDVILDFDRACMSLPETNMYDLMNMPEAFDGTVVKKNLTESIVPMEGYFADGQKAPDSFFQKLRSNVAAGEASENMALQYAVCVKRANLRVYPTETLLSDAPDDPEFDLLQNSFLRLNEPFVIKFVTGDGKFCYGMTTNCEGWVAAENLAVCHTRLEWAQAWNSGDTLVITGDKVFTQDSNVSPETANLQLDMGTVLNLVPAEALPPSVAGRFLWNNYTVYFPLRDENGMYVKGYALIPESSDVNVGFLPVTQRNVLTLAFKSLGNRYGWGGMLSNRDCSQYIRDIYKCFGMELPRNTTWQTRIPVKKYDLTTAEDKEAVLDSLPAGAVMNFRGHTMLYLGKAGGNYYVISALGSVRDPYGLTDSVTKIRSVAVNTLNEKRANGTTWLENMTVAYIPWEFILE